MSDACETANCSFTGITHISKKDFQMLLTLKESHTYPPQGVLGHIYEQQSKNNNLKNTKKLTTEIILRCTPCQRHQNGSDMNKNLKEKQSPHPEKSSFITMLYMYNINSNRILKVIEHFTF